MSDGSAEFNCNANSEKDGLAGCWKVFTATACGSQQHRIPSMPAVFVPEDLPPRGPERSRVCNPATGVSRPVDIVFVDKLVENL